MQTFVNFLVPLLFYRKEHEVWHKERTQQQFCIRSNPGIGMRHLFKNIYEARSKDGARVYFRKTVAGFEILAKSDKNDQNAVIKLLRQYYDE